MKELVEVIASALVDSPEDVVVTETEDEKQIVLNLTVAPEDMGKVIGKQGRIAKAIRTVVRAAGSKGDKKIMVDIQEGWGVVSRHEFPAGFCLRGVLYLTKKRERMNYGRFTANWCCDNNAWDQRGSESIPDNG